MNPIIYRLDSNDIIHSIEGPWDEFALENDGYPENKANNVLGTPIWAYIKDFETKHIYKLIFDHIRLLKKEFIIPIRCDGPTIIRYIDLTLAPLPEDKIEFVCKIKKETKRDKIDILDKNLSRNENFIKMCSYCKSIKVDENNWMGTVEAIFHLGLFNEPSLPKISHGVCPRCYNKVIRELESYKLAFNQKNKFT